MKVLHMYLSAVKCILLFPTEMYSYFGAEILY